MAQSRRVLEHILGTGIETETRQGVNALTAMQQTMTFPLAEGFPVIQLTHKAAILKRR